jgi:hypothetical protein
MTDMTTQVDRLISLVETAARGAADMTPAAIEKVGGFLQMLAITELGFHVFGVLVFLTIALSMVLYVRRSARYLRSLGDEWRYSDRERHDLTVFVSFWVVAICLGLAVLLIPPPKTIVAATSPEAALMVAVHNRVSR